MSAQQSASFPRHGQPLAGGLPIGDLRGFGRVRDDASLACLALDRAQGLLAPSQPERPLLALRMEGEVAWLAGYVPGTNVLETTGRIGDAELRMVDFMPLAEGRPGQGESIAAGRFVRLISCVEGEVAFELVCAAAVDAEDGVSARTRGGWYLACSQPLTFADETASSRVRLVAGESMVFVMALAPLDGGPRLVANTLHGLGDTIHYWTWWSDRCRYRGDDFNDRLRDALGLKLACVPGGGVLCENPGGNGFVPAPLRDCSRAAANFLELGYRQECVELLAYVHAQTVEVQVPHWSADECFVSTLASFVARYGSSGLPDPLRDAAAAPSTRAHLG